MKFKVNNPKKFKVEEIIANNLEIFYKLSAVGMKNISTAVDYFIILETYKKYYWIKNFKERKSVTADQCKTTIRTVENALALMSSIIEFKE